MPRTSLGTLGRPGAHRTYGTAAQSACTPLDRPSAPGPQDTPIWAGATSSQGREPRCENKVRMQFSSRDPCTDGGGSPRHPRGQQPRGQVPAMGVTGAWTLCCSWQRTANSPAGATAGAALAILVLSSGSMSSLCAPVAMEPPSMSRRPHSRALYTLAVV